MKINTFAFIALLAAALSGCDDGRKLSDKERKSQEAMDRCSDEAEEKYPFSFNRRNDYTDKCMDAFKEKETKGAAPKS